MANRPSLERKRRQGSAVEFGKRGAERRRGPVEPALLAAGALLAYVEQHSRRRDRQAEPVL